MPPSLTPPLTYGPTPRTGRARKPGAHLPHPGGPALAIGGPKTDAARAFGGLQDPSPKPQFISATWYLSTPSLTPSLSLWPAQALANHFFSFLMPPGPTFWLLFASILGTLNAGRPNSHEQGMVESGSPLFEYFFGLFRARAMYATDAVIRGTQCPDPMTTDA